MRIYIYIYIYDLFLPFRKEAIGHIYIYIYIYIRIYTLCCLHLIVYFHLCRYCFNFGFEGLWLFALFSIILINILESIVFLRIINNDQLFCFFLLMGSKVCSNIRKQQLKCSNEKRIQFRCWNVDVYQSARIETFSYIFLTVGDLKLVWHQINPR